MGENVVIRNDSEIGLSQYYDSAEAVYNEQGFVANVVNTVTKLFTGKSLAERMLEKFPRLAVTAGVELAYGVDDLMVECMEESKTTLTYSFGSGSVSMGSMYNMKEINLVLLFIAVISVFGFVMKALWGVIGRLFDILVLFILGPVAISTVALKSDSKDKSGQFVEGGDLVAGAYDQWKKTLIDRILLAFGYIFGLNVFFILVPMISNIQMFTETSMFAGVPMFGELPLGLANAIGSLIFLISLSSIITYAPALLSKIMDFQNAVQYGSIVQSRVKNVVKEAQDGITGRKMMDGMAKTWENAKNFVPGIAQMKIVKDKISKENTKFKMNHMKKQALKNGVDPKVAEEAVKAYKASLDQQKKNKATRNKERAEARRKRDEERQRFDEV